MIKLQNTDYSGIKVIKKPACAAVAYLTGRIKKNKVKVIARGGEMTIEIGKDSIFIIGPAHRVFEGEMCLEI